MASIVESSEDAILSTTPDGVITSWNRGAEDLYGYTADEAIGRHVSLVAPPERYYEITNHTAKLKRGERVESLQTERMRKDGTRVSILLSISPVRDEHDAVVGTSAIGRDITAQKRTEEVLRRNERLATAGRLAASIAHEINNPLEAVTNLLYLAGHNDERRDEYLHLAEQEVQRVANIAQQTLGFVRETTSAAIVDVAEILNEVLQLYGRKLQEKHIDVRLDFEPTLPIQGFAGELRQLFSNLIINSIDAMDSGGTLHIRITPGRDWIHAGREGVRVTIADTGIGIRPSDLQRIFDPFYTTKKDVGTGLGLWVTYGIVQKHSGQIRVRSSTGPGPTGTVFSIFFPAAEQQAKASAVARQPAQARQ
jgi:PAS domain S-box-containing protein